MVDSIVTTDDPNPGWHSWFLNSPKHTSKLDRPEREVIAFSTGFEMLKEPIKGNQIGTFMQWIVKCVVPILIILSIVANVLIIRVMHHISKWKFPPCLYIVILSVIDISLNTVRLIDGWCQVVFSVKFLNSLSLTSEAVCSTLTISMYFLYHLASLIRSALCIDVYYSFKCPLESNKQSILCRIEHFVLLFISVLLIFNSHFLWTYSLIHMNRRQNLVPPGNYCTIMVKWVSPTFRDVIWPTVDIFIGEICPLVSVIVSSILVALMSMRKLHNNIKGQLSAYVIDVDAFKEMRRFMLIYNLITFLLILVPSAVTFIYKGLTFQKNHAMKLVTTFSTSRSSTRTYVDPDDISILNLTNQCISVMYPIIVVAAGWQFSKKGFRKELLSLSVNKKDIQEVKFLI